MAIRGEITIECDSPDCHAEQIYGPVALLDCGLGDCLADDGWQRARDGTYTCPQCNEQPDERDEAYERAAARARNNDFADTGGKDWT